MRRELLGLLAPLVAGTGLTYGQTYRPPTFPAPPLAVQPTAEPVPIGAARHGVKNTQFGGIPTDVPGVLPEFAKLPPGGASVVTDGGGHGPQIRTADDGTALITDNLRLAAYSASNPTHGGGSAAIFTGNAVPPELRGAPVAPDVDNYWVDTEWLIWFINDRSPGVPLATTGNTAGGVLDDPNTVVLGNNLKQDVMNGLRVTAGAWLDHRNTFGFEASGFLFEKKAAGFNFASDPLGNPVLARPFFDLDQNMENARLVAFPGAFAGNIRAVSTSDLWGAEGNFVHRIAGDSGLRSDMIYGFRFLDLNERLLVSDNSAFLPGGISFFNGVGINGSGSISVSDMFATRNQFYGAQIGNRTQWINGRWTFDVSGKLALGGLQRTVTQMGTSTLYGTTTANTVVPAAIGNAGPPFTSGLGNGTILTAPTAVATTTTVPGGLYIPGFARTSSSTFAVLPEFGFRVGYQLMPRLNVSAGYNVLYLNSVARAASQLRSRVVNPLVVPTSPLYAGLPAAITPLPVEYSDLVVHGVNLGLSLSY
jgi:hypothetical protein